MYKNTVWFTRFIKQYKITRKLLTLNLKAASLKMNSNAKTAVNSMFNKSRALLYSGDWLWYFMARVIVLIMISTKMAYSKGCEVTNHHTLYWIRCFGMYLKDVVILFKGLRQYKRFNCSLMRLSEILPSYRFSFQCKLNAVPLVLV